MGDRAMAQINTEGGSLYVYTHWGGHALPETAKQAVKTASPRHGDYSYETRIIVDQLTKEGRDEGTGFGLMLTPNAEDAYNNDEPSVIIDLITETITVKRNDHEQIIPFSEL